MKLTKSLLILILGIVIIMCIIKMPSYIHDNTKHVKNDKTGFKEVEIINQLVDIEDEIYLEINKYRLELGIKQVSKNSRLIQSSYTKAQHTQEYCYWAHFGGEDNESPYYFANQSGYKYRALGEVLAEGYGSGRKIVDAWKNSETHNYVLSDPVYEDIGVTAFTDKCTNKLHVVAHLGRIDNR